jgi:glyoxylase-like metal-dependent hydrolase (beta-lactamase superfamily II)
VTPAATAYVTQPPASHAVPDARGRAVRYEKSEGDGYQRDGDRGVGRRNGAYVLEHAKRLAGGRPVFLTITHFHPEHGFGAQVFKGEATIIYNRPQRDELHR